MNKKTFGAFLLTLLLLFIFLSGTIYNYRLPLVTAGAPKNGKLNKTETASGITAWTDTMELYTPLAGKLAEILVGEGDTVIKNQPLFRMVYDIDDLQKQMTENEINQRRLEVECENIKLKTQNINRKMDELRDELYKADPVSRYELTQLEMDIAKAEEACENLKDLYDKEVITRKELDDALFSLQSKYAQRDELTLLLAEQEEKNAETAADKENSRKKQLKDYQYELETLRQDTKMKALEQENLTLQRAYYEKALEDYAQNSYILAPEDGIILSLPVTQGQQINENQLMAAFGLGNRFNIECYVALSNNFVHVGDACRISNTERYFDAVVSKVTPVEKGKQITLSFSSDEVSAGETFEIVFEKESGVSYTLVPTGAVNRDGEGYYLYQIKRRDGILGKEFYPVKQRIYIGDSDNEYTAVTSGVTFFEPIVLTADKYFAENDTIKLVNESDFFE